MTEPPAAARPLTLGSLTLRNRIVAAPMERNYCNLDGTMTEIYLQYLSERAEAGVALVMTEATYVRADGKGRAHQLGAHDDTCIPGLRALAEAMHVHGALVGCQLNHGGATTQTATSGLPTVAPSAIPCDIAGGQVPRELTRAEVYELVADFGTAARRCVEAGIDVLSIQGGHGYLVHQFMSPLGNQRTDEFADPVLFLNLVIDAVRESAPDTPLGLRLSVIEGADGGLDAGQTLAIVARAHLDKFDFFDLSAGSYAAGEWIVQSGEWRPAVLSEYAHAYRRFGKPLGMAGRLNSTEVVERVLGDGTVDFVSLARALHADPAFATACLDNSPYRPCIACNVCIDTLGTGPAGCSVNPTVGRGRVPVTTPKLRPGTTAVVVGAGPAGLTSARELAVAGAAVTVIDDREELGGDMALAAGMKSTPEFHRFLDWTCREFERLGVTLVLDTVANQPMVATLKPDVVLWTTGGEPRRPEIPAAGDTPVLEIREWLRTRDRTIPLVACTIWGADTVGMSVADTLAAEGTSVLLVGAETEIAPASGRRAKILAVPRLTHNSAVRIRLSSSIEAVAQGRVLVARADGAQEWLDAPGPLLISQGLAGRQGSDEVTTVQNSTVRTAVLSGYDSAQNVARRLGR